MEPPLASVDDLIRQDYPEGVLIRLTRGRVVSEDDVQRIGDALLHIVNSEGRNHLVLDLAGVDFLASAFLGKLLWVLIQLRKRGGRMALCHLNETMIRLFQPSSGHAPEGLGFFDNPADALAWVATPRDEPTH